MKELIIAVTYLMDYSQNIAWHQTEIVYVGST